MLRLTGIIVLAASLLCAQEFRSTLTGRVADSSGAVVAGAQVAAIEESTNTRYETVSTTDGLYTFPLLLPGTYQLTAEVDVAATTAAISEAVLRAWLFMEGEYANRGPAGRWST